MLAIAAAMIGAIVIPGYLQEVKAATKTHSLSTSMSTACNGETDEPCQTIVCKNDKPCRNLDSNSSQPQQQPDSSNDDEMTHLLQTPPIPQIPNYSDYGFD